jgi:hypothetical protein
MQSVGAFRVNGSLQTDGGSLVWSGAIGSVKPPTTDDKVSRRPPGPAELGALSEADAPNRTGCLRRNHQRRSWGGRAGQQKEENPPGPDTGDQPRAMPLLLSPGRRYGGRTSGTRCGKFGGGTPGRPTPLAGRVCAPTSWMRFPVHHLAHGLAAGQGRDPPVRHPPGYG